jgi:hypothetical protein
MYQFASCARANANSPSSPTTDALSNPWTISSNPRTVSNPWAKS